MDASVGVFFGSSSVSYGCVSVGQWYHKWSFMALVPYGCVSVGKAILEVTLWYRMLAVPFDRLLPIEVFGTIRVRFRRLGYNY